MQPALNLKTDPHNRKVFGKPSPCRYCGAGIRTHKEAYQQTLNAISQETPELELTERIEQALAIADSELEQGIKIGSVVLSSDGATTLYKVPNKCCPQAAAPKQQLSKPSPSVELNEPINLNDIRASWRIFGEHWSKYKPLSPELEKVYLEELKHLKKNELKAAVKKIIRSSSSRYETTLAQILELSRPQPRKENPVMEGLK